MSWIVPSPVSLRQAPDMSVVLVVDVLVVVVLVVLVLVVVGGSAHKGTPSVQLHCPALQEEMIPLLHIRFALPFKPTHRALMAPLQRLGLQGGLRASIGDAEMPSPRITPSAMAAILPYCVMCPLGASRVIRFARIAERKLGCPAMYRGRTYPATGISVIAMCAGAHATALSQRPG